MTTETTRSRRRRGYALLGGSQLISGITFLALYGRQLAAGETPFLAWAAYASLTLSIALVCLYWFATTYRPVPVKSRGARAALTIALLVVTALAIVAALWAIAGQSLQP